MPNFQLSIDIDGRKLNSRTEFEIRLEQLSNHTFFNKTEFDRLTKNQIYILIEKWLQIHSLKCKRCKSNKVCYSSEVVINFSEVLF
jgi:hypothetical protein